MIIMNSVDELPKNIYDRLEYIEFMLWFRGWVSRADLSERFGLSLAAATRDISKYRDLAEQNLSLNQSSKKYEINENSFKPLLELNIQTALSKIRNEQISKALGMDKINGILCPPRLALPKIEVLATITRAISGGKRLIMEYRSVQNGLSNKNVIPHAVFDNGFHWYFRAYDEDKKRYCSYAITRVVSLNIDGNYNEDTAKEITRSDFQWNRMVTLDLVPHPNRKNVPCPETIEHDFNMENGCLVIQVRATVAGYWLHHWNVDCTENHSLEGYNYQLWLRNHLTLYDVESREIAPGLSKYAQAV
jgi:predicted DNA-binding transcriptional regulator YafY